MKKILTFCVCLSVISSLQAQTTEDSVKTVIGNFFAAMHQSDSAAAMNCFVGYAMLQTVNRDQKNNAVVRSESVPGFTHIIGSLPKGAADERISFDFVKADGPLAVAWMPYRFYFNGQFSHCGVDCFQLIRVDGKWKIHYIIDTRRKDGCE
jgi:hypothetical protein